jgi:nicotinamidase-related amidase
MKRHLHLLLIDPQNDFCDLPDAYRPLDPAGGGKLAPALPVAGAHADLQRTAQLIRTGGAGIAGISVTLDSHHRIDIAHPAFWQAAGGGAVAPFTPITASDVREGRYAPRKPAAMARALSYLDALEAAGRYQLMVWPVHCEIGSWGHNVHADVRAAYNHWEETTLRSVHKVIKGANPWTEHYSAVLAEVPDPQDKGTQLNTDFIAHLGQAERIYIAGQAGSHCVKATVEDIARQFGPARRNKLVLLTDCMSPVAGFEAQQQAFLAAMAEQGLRLTTAAEASIELAENA